MRFTVHFAIAALASCAKAPPPPAPPNPPIIADPVLGQIDQFDLRLSHVRDRLARLPATLAPDQAAAQALILAAEDLLALREMAVLKAPQQPGERPWQAAERFAASVWRDVPTCEADPGDVKLLYLQHLGKYKHPAKFAIWDAQLLCCVDLDHCPPAALSACQTAARPALHVLRADVQARFAALPPLDGAADVTSVTLELSPVKGPRTDAMESAIADFATRDPRLQLRRYDFYRRGEPGFGEGHFRPGEPSIAQWADAARLGDVSEPIDTVWGLSVVLLAAREPTLSGKADPTVMARLNAEACAQMASRQRQEWRDGLLRAARLRWDQRQVESNFGAAVYRRLPQNVSRFGQVQPRQP